MANGQQTVMYNPGGSGSDFTAPRMDYSFNSTPSGWSQTNWSWPTTQNPWGSGDPWGGGSGTNPFDVWNNQSWTNAETRGNMKSWLENWAFPSAQQQLNENIAARDYQLGMMDRQANWEQVLFNQALAQKQYNLQATSMEQENKQFYDQFAQNRWAKEQEFAIASEQNSIDQAYKQGLITNQQYQAETDRLAQKSAEQKWQQELQAQQMQWQQANALAAQQQQWQQGFSQQELMQKQNQFLKQYGLQEQQQQWQQGFSQQELAEKQKQFQQSFGLQEKQYGLQEQQQQWQQGFSQQELAAKQQQSRLEAFGRREAPNSRWAATWR